MAATNATAAGAAAAGGDAAGIDAATARATVRLDVADAVATITLDRPEALNALTVPMKRMAHMAMKGWYNGSTHVHMNWGGNLHQTPVGATREP